MERNSLIEIKKGKTGTGLLIENDGYISLLESNNRQLYESIIKEDGGYEIPRPFVVSAVMQKFGIQNANGRIYPETVLKREVEKYQQKIKERRAYGECNHPQDSTIDLGRLAMNVIELHWEDHTLMGKLEIPISEGFRKYGIISCLADTVAHWILSGLKVGVSSRGIGSCVSQMGKIIVGDDYEIICWDVVSDPSTPGSWISPNSENLMQYIENTTKPKNNLLSEDKKQKLDSIYKWLRVN